MMADSTPTGAEMPRGDMVVVAADDEMPRGRMDASGPSAQGAASAESETGAAARSEMPRGEMNRADASEMPSGAMA